MNVRKLHRGDAEAWASLRLEALQNHPWAFGSSVPDDPKLLADMIVPRLIAMEESAVFGAFDEDTDDALIGVVGIVRNDGKKERHKALIWGMYVTASRRRNGAGQSLMEAAIQQARDWPGIEQVHLAVSEVTKEARRLYDRLGFQEWGREPRALIWEGRSADEFHMVLDLRDKTP